ncbi:MAG: cytochrome c5 family protein [Granulosicoccus sp.]
MQVWKHVRITIQCVLSGALLSISAHASEEYPPLSDELASGRVVWLKNCETCHAYGIAGAPNPLQPPEWNKRLNTPLNTLYEHAIQGFYGKTDTFMPPRGGNPQLSDSEVQSAVDYMLALAKFYLSIKER